MVRGVPRLAAVAVCLLVHATGCAPGGRSDGQRVPLQGTVVGKEFPALAREIYMALSSINPATGQLLATFETLTPADVAAALDRAATAFRSWRETPPEERARLLTRAADILDAESEQFGRLMTLEMGKPLRAGIDEALKCARGCRY